MISGFRHKNEIVNHVLDIPLFDRIESNEFIEVQEDRKMKEVFL